MARAMASTCAQPDGVVFGAVVDVVARRVGLADAEVVVVRGVDDDLVLELGIAARQQAGDVRRAHARDLVVDLDRRLERQRHRLEAAALRRGDELVEILARGLAPAGARPLRWPSP